MTFQDSVGWLSALILVVTLWRQIFQQWHAPTAEGVSIWLFIGQAAANTGFVVYSILLDSLVFITVNSMLLCVSIVGLISLHLKRKREQEKTT